MFDQAFGIHATALGLRSQRAELLANNLANADTPGYKARDLDFRAILAGQAGGGERLRRTHERHLDAAVGAAGGEPLYRQPLQSSIDGNTVDTQIEQAEFMKNAMAYEASLRFLNGRIGGLMTALRGE